MPGWSSSTSSLMKFLLIARSTPPPCWTLRSLLYNLYSSKKASASFMFGSNHVSVPITMSGFKLSRMLCTRCCLFFIDWKLMFNILWGALHFDLDLFIRMGVDWCDGFWKICWEFVNHFDHSHCDGINFHMGWNY